MSEHGHHAESNVDHALTLTGSHSDVETSTTQSSPRVLVAPLHYEPGYNYPLLVWLHGESGERERELLDVMPQMDLQHYVAVAPRGIETPHGSFACSWPQTEDGVLQAESRVLHAMATAKKRFRIASDRIFIAGHQSGGTVAVRLAWRYPELFAGAISLCGPIPRTHRALAHYDKVRKLPLLLTVGRDCDCYSPWQAAADLKLLHMAGINVMLRQYPGCSRLSSHMLADVNRWIMEIAAGDKIVR
ncbi:MAG: alpha/beta hydrolase [Thermogutta sp.]